MVIWFQLADRMGNDSTLTVKVNTQGIPSYSLGRESLGNLGRVSFPVSFRKFVDTRGRLTADAVITEVSKEIKKSYRRLVSVDSSHRYIEVSGGEVTDGPVAWFRGEDVFGNPKTVILRIKGGVPTFSAYGSWGNSGISYSVEDTTDLKRRDLQKAWYQGGVEEVGRLLSRSRYFKLKKIDKI